MYLRGEGVAKDYAQALRWFQKAAAQGHTGSRIKLGYMYAEGLGTPRDAEAAYTWITSASLAGDPRGQYLVSSLEARLTPRQIAEAQEKARQLVADRGQTLSGGVLARY
jgi:uncharacterized protein